MIDSVYSPSLATNQTLSGGSLIQKMWVDDLCIDVAGIRVVAGQLFDDISGSRSSDGQNLVNLKNNWSILIKCHVELHVNLVHILNRSYFCASYIGMYLQSLM